MTHPLHLPALKPISCELHALVPNGLSDFNLWVWELCADFCWPWKPKQNPGTLEPAVGLQSWFNFQDNIAWQGCSWLLYPKLISSTHAHTLDMSLVERIKQGNTIVFWQPSTLYIANIINTRFSPNPPNLWRFWIWLDLASISNVLSPWMHRLKIKTCAFHRRRQQDGRFHNTNKKHPLKIKPHDISVRATTKKGTELFWELLLSV